MREKPVSRIASAQHTVTHFFLRHTASVPNTVAVVCVWPLGKEYPVAASRAASTIVKFSSSTQGRGIRKTAFKSWFNVFPTRPMKKKRKPHFLSKHHKSAMPTSMNTVSSPSIVTSAATPSKNGVRIASNKRRNPICSSGLP